jgi:cell division protein FtsQ
MVGAIAVATLVALGWTLFFSPLLYVRNVKVVGAQFLTDEEVAEAGGLLGESHRNILLLATNEIAVGVAALPWVGEVDVDRMLPGTVRIRIEERQPALVLSLGAAKWTIDARGNVLATGEAVDDLPVLAGVEVGDIEPGLRLMTDESRAALLAFRSLPKSLRTRVVGVFAPTVERITFSLREGTSVRYGAAEQIRDKNEVLQVLLRRLDDEGRTAAYIDVRVPTSPAVAPADVR